MLDCLSLLFLHSILEMLPISSSWHLKYFFQANSATTHIFHIWLIPILLTLLSLRFRVLDKSSAKIIFWAALPSSIIYFGTKLGLINKWALPIGWTHLLMGICLLLASIRQHSLKASPYKLPVSMAWISIGWMQSFGMLIPGSSRLGTSFLPAMIWPIEFRQALVISYALDMLCLTASAGLDIINSALIFPNITELFLASLGFYLGWAALEKYQWNLIGLIGIYRITIGIALLFHYI